MNSNKKSASQAQAAQAAQAIGIKGGNRSQRNHGNGQKMGNLSIDSSVGLHASASGAMAATALNSPSNGLNSANSLNNSQNNTPQNGGGNRKRNLYKTEMCRTAEETGECPYGTKCQFAHSLSELRVVDRHPRYKTEMCKTFWEHGTCPYGRRCCFLHSKKELEETSSQPGSPIMGAGKMPKSAQENNITLHSPRARTVTVQGFEAPVEKRSPGGRNGLSPVLARLDIGGNVHGRTNSVPLEIHTREIKSAHPSMSTSFQKSFGTPTRSSYQQHAWDDEDGPIQSPSVYDRQPFSAGVEMKKSWDNVPFMKAPLSSSVQQSSLAAPFSPSRANSGIDHPWLSSSVNESSSQSAWPTSPKPVPATISTDSLGSALGKLSVATNFTSDFRSRNVGSFSAIPFKEQAGSFPNTPLERTAFSGAISAFPDSIHATTGFFPDSPIHNSPMSSSMSGRSMILTESVSTKNGFPDTYGSLRNGMGSIVGSPLATSFGEERPFGSAFSEPPSSPYGRSHGRSRQTLRDVWASSIPATQEEGVIKTSPPLSEGGVGDYEQVQKTNTSLVSPPVTPQRRMN